MPSATKTPSITKKQTLGDDIRRGTTSTMPEWPSLSINIVNELHDAIFTSDLNGVITGYNDAFRHYGFTSQELLGKNISDVFLCENEKDFAQVLSLVVQKGRYASPAQVRTKSGQIREVHLCLNLVPNLNGGAAGIFGFSIELEAESHSRPDFAQASPIAEDNALPLARRVIDRTEFVMVSPILHKFMGMVDRVAGHTEAVLIIGETGTGKELVARTIHESSYRCKRPLVDINCAALPEQLVESELFGYEKGAFSGADSSKPGLFELADKSTIFLDEIGELQPQVQVKLLRVLDGVPYYRLGGHRKITVDVRVVAATNQDLELAVKEGRFRKDLFHRLSQFQLRVPPLRERPEDVSALARHFLKLKAFDKSFSLDALSALQSHSWPGNVRELRNLVARLALVATEPQISGEDVLHELYRDQESPANLRRALPSSNLENMEEQMIIRALEQTGGHRTQAAEQLGISRRTLSRKLREYRIAVPSDDSTPLGTISQDQQKFFRAKVNIPVTLRNADGEELQVHAVNLSTGGMGLDALNDAAGFTGLLDVSFLLPDTETPMQVKGRVVWADVGGRAGLRFVVIDPRLFEALQHWSNQRMKDEGWGIPS
jgi:PAS domain S-box-containing protein